MSIDWSPDYKSLKEGEKFLTDDDRKAIDEMWTPGAVTIRMAKALEECRAETRARVLIEVREAVHALSALEADRILALVEAKAAECVVDRRRDIKAWIGKVLTLFHAGGPLDQGKEAGR